MSGERIRRRRRTEALVAGIDEVGRGPLAGPVLAAAVVLRCRIDGVTDSKALACETRNALCRVILEEAWVGIGSASVAEIDRVNILQATFLAMHRAFRRLPVTPAKIYVDGNRAPPGLPGAVPIVDGDAGEPSIGAASIVAKVVRDGLMARLALRYDGYGFGTNAGYGTPEHIQGLRALGPTIHHRRSFAPVRQALALHSAVPLAPELFQAEDEVEGGPRGELVGVDLV